MKKFFTILFVFFISICSYAVTGNSVVIKDSKVYVTQIESGTLYPLFKSTYTGKNVTDMWGEDVWDFVKELHLSGNIDARDFNTIKWNFRSLEVIDLSDAKIQYYKGELGTNEGYYRPGDSYSIYKEDEIPMGAFFYWMSHKFRSFPKEFNDEGYHSLKKITLPPDVKIIRRNAFARNYNLEEINFPEGIISIDFVAFRYCRSIKVLNLPSTLKNIGEMTFTDMYSLREVHIKAKNPPSEYNTFGNYPDSDKRGSIKIGDSEYNKISKAVLYVPKGCSEKYKGWKKYFSRIEEE